MNGECPECNEKLYYDICPHLMRCMKCNYTTSNFTLPFIPNPVKPKRSFLRKYVDGDFNMYIPVTLYFIAGTLLYLTIMALTL